MHHIAQDQHPDAMLGSGVIRDGRESHRQDARATVGGDIRKGFVYKRVPHVTLKSIANNEEIDVIHVKWQPQIDDALTAINKALKAKFEEWEVPRTADDESRPVSGRSSAATRGGSDGQKLLDTFWELRRKRQKEIHDCIARHAHQELLYDQPYEDNFRLRVTGPFIVESLSPHLRLTVADKQDRAAGKDGLSVRVIGPDQFGNMMIDNLRKAGIQARDKNERLKFDTLEPFAGEWIHAKGTYTDAVHRQDRREGDQPLRR